MDIMEVTGLAMELEAKLETTRNFEIILVVHVTSTRLGNDTRTGTMTFFYP